MSEKLVTPRVPQFCDICGHRIQAGERCRRIRDDFMPCIMFFKHIRCPVEAPTKQSVLPNPSTLCNP